MSADQVRETMSAYVEVLRARGDYRRFFAEDIRFEIVGTDQSARGAEAAEHAIRFFHEIAFDAQPEISKVLVDDDGAAAEAMFVGKHIGDFAGVGATGRAVRVPYSVFYELDAGLITALRIYLSMDQLLTQIGSRFTPRRPNPSSDEHSEPHAQRCVADVAALRIVRRVVLPSSIRGTFATGAIRVARCGVDEVLFVQDVSICTGLSRAWFSVRSSRRSLGRPKWRSSSRGHGPGSWSTREPGTVDARTRGAREPDTEL